jgi:hypothetical protein
MRGHSVVKCRVRDHLPGQRRTLRPTPGRPSRWLFRWRSSPTGLRESSGPLSVNCTVGCERENPRAPGPKARNNEPSRERRENALSRRLTRSGGCRDPLPILAIKRATPGALWPGVSRKLVGRQFRDRSLISPIRPRTWNLPVNRSNCRSPAPGRHTERLAANPQPVLHCRLPLTRHGSSHDCLLPTPQATLDRLQ